MNINKINLNQIDMSRVEEQLDEISTNVSEILDIVSSGGGGGEGTGEIRVRFFYRDFNPLSANYGREIIVSRYYNKGDNAVFPTVQNLPAIVRNAEQTQPALIFTDWTHTQEHLNDLQHNIDVGAMYSVENGRTTAFITVTRTTGSDEIDALNQVCYLNRSSIDVEITMRVSGADGYSQDYISPASDTKFNIQFILPSIGRYMIEIFKNNGDGTYGLGNDSNITVFLGGNIQSKKDILTELFVGTDIKIISAYAFSSCFSLASIVIPNSVTYISNYSFNSCYSLSSVIIPNSVTSISRNIFIYCHSLSNIVIPNSVTYIDTYAFSGCHLLASIVIPNSVTSIDAYAFQYCYSLSSVIIPNSVTSINGNNIFQSCYSLSSVIIPNSVTSISGDNIFHSCNSLAVIVIPTSVTSINSRYAFQSCYLLIKYVIESTIPPTISTVSLFTAISSIAKIYVPDESVEAYKTATNWSIVANRIFPMSEMLD